jgi:WD40 repeat protein
VRKNRTALTSGTDGRLIQWDLATGLDVKKAMPRRLPPPASGGTAAKEPDPTLAYVALAPDQTFAATAGFDGTVRLWRLDPLSELEPVLDHSDESVWMVTISHDGSRLLSGTNVGQVWLWERSPGVPVSQKDAWTATKVGGRNHSVAALAFVPGSTRFAMSGGGDGHVRLWDLDEKKQVWEVPEPELHGHPVVNCIVFSPDATKVATASFDGSLIIWDVQGKGRDMTLRERHRVSLGDYKLWRTDFSPDGKLIAAASDDGRVGVWDADTGTVVHQFRAQTGGALGVAFVDDRTLVSTGDDTPDASGLVSALDVWGLDSQEYAIPGFKPKQTVSRITVSKKGEVDIETGSMQVRLYVGQDGVLHTERRQGPLAEPGVPKSVQNAVRRPGWSLGGRSITARGGRAGLAGGGVVEVAPLSGGRAKLVAGPDNSLELWGMSKTGGGSALGEGGPVALRCFPGHKSRIIASGVSPDERYVVSVDEQGNARAWDLFRPALCHELEANLVAAREQLKDDGKENLLTALREWYALFSRDESGAPAGAKPAAVN